MQPKRGSFRAFFHKLRGRSPSDLGSTASGSRHSRSLSRDALQQAQVRSGEPENGQDDGNDDRPASIEHYRDSPGVGTSASETRAGPESDPDIAPLAGQRKTQFAAQPDISTNVPAIVEISAEGVEYPTWDPKDEEAQHKVYPSLGTYDNTRLVTIEPPGVDESILDCSSHAVALHDDGIAYAALSYAWGSGPESKQIVLNGYRYPVREILYDALIALRRLGVRTAWVDSLSIDQENIADKDRQIGMMHVIYAQADAVYAWLGNKYDGSQPEFKDCDGEAGVALLSEEPSKGPLNHQDILNVQSIAARPYWTRCWIIQELCRSQNAWVLCGRSKAKFTEFWNNFQTFDVLTDYRWVGQDLRVHLDGLKAFHMQESKKSRDPQMPLIQALLLSQYSKSKNARDKIFAMLHLAHDGNKLVPTPNYRQSTNTIFWKLAHNFVNLQGHVAIILLARRDLSDAKGLTAHQSDKAKPKSLGPNHATRPRSASTTHQRLSSLTANDVKAFTEGDNKLPSWVPVWSEIDDQLPPWIEESIKTKWMGTQFKQGPPATSHEGSELRVRGVLLDDITATSGMIGGEAKYSTPQPSAQSSRHEASIDLGLTMTLSRRSSTKIKTFTSALDVLDKLWNAVMGPVRPEQKNEPPRTHQCSSFTCASAEIGYACASVLMGHGYLTNDSIRKWFGANRTLQLGNQDLQSWVNELLEDDGSPKHEQYGASRTRRSSQQLALCSYAVEADWLGRAFETLEKYKMRLAVTSRCTFKVVYREAGPGDVICRLDGCSLPVVLRGKNDGQQMDSLLKDEAFQNFDMPPALPLIHIPSALDLSNGIGRWSSSAHLAPAGAEANLPSDGSDLSEGPIPARKAPESRSPARGVTAEDVRSQNVPRNESYGSLPDPGPSLAFERWEYIGEVYLHDHQSQSEFQWTDQAKTGWKRSHFASKWPDLSIA